MLFIFLCTLSDDALFCTSFQENILGDIGVKELTRFSKKKKKLKEHNSAKNCRWSFGSWSLHIAKVMERIL